MQLAVLGDINGNICALEAVLHAIEEAGILTIFHTGNSVVGHPEGAAVLERLQAAQVVCVQGDQDRQLVRFGKKPPRDAALHAAMQHAYETLHSTALEYLRTLPKKRSLEMEEISIAVTHGSLTSQAEILSAETSSMRLQRQREITPADLILCGGSPTPFYRQIANTFFVGPGWVDEAPGRARYAVVDTEEEMWSVDFPHVSYTVEEHS